MTQHIKLETYRRAVSEARALPDEVARREAQNKATQMRNEWVNELAQAVVVDWVGRGWQGATIEQAFWFNHFNVFAPKAEVGAALPDYWHSVIVNKVGYKFDDLLLSAATHPAMLVYLDNTQNRKGRLNENLARELMELHTLGRDGGYGQGDVQEVARLLTGLSLSPLPGAPAPRVPTPLQQHIVQQGDTFFNPAGHDFAPKRVLGQTIEGLGWPELEALCDVLAGHPSTARHVCRQYLRCLTGADPDEAMLSGAIDLWRQWRGHRQQLGRWSAAVQAQLVKLPHAPGQALKTPWQWLVEVAHAVGAGRTLLQPARLVRWCQQLGQPLFLRSTPDGYPWKGQDWASPGQLTQRWQVARALVGEQARLFGPGAGLAAGSGSASALSPQALLDTPLLRQWQEHVSPQTAAVLGAAPNAAERLVLLLLAPETMTHGWVVLGQFEKG